MSASLALLLNCSSGSSVQYDACSLVLFGRYTSLFDFPFFGMFISSGTKFDVALESNTNFIVRLLLIRRVHLFDLVFAIDCFADITLICLTCSSLLLHHGIGPSSSWLPGTCDLFLFYSTMSLSLVATSLILWAPRT